MLFNDFFGKYFGNVFVDLRDQCPLQFPDAFAIEPLGFEILSCVIHRLHPLGSLNIFFRSDVNFRMSDVDLSVEDARLAKHNEFGVDVELWGHPFDAFEPNKLHHACFIAHLSNEALPFIRSGNFGMLDFCFELHKGHILIDLFDLVELSAVHVPEGKMIEQIAKSADSKSTCQRRSPLRAYPFEEFNIGI